MFLQNFLWIRDTMYDPHKTGGIDPNKVVTFSSDVRGRGSDDGAVFAVVIIYLLSWAFIVYMIYLILATKLIPASIPHQADYGPPFVYINRTKGTRGIFGRVY
ncbi:unnamed protein product [Allacma fusca]|uniref:Uncharacterized protein n=1 Tax=Allacma fusca TaxID=39272 RepID=A0A8J2PJC5_9HEXA|nr:unnamed protein product [Allacma fusca]